MKLARLWKAILGEIEVNLEPSSYATWFSKTQLLSYDEDNFVVGVPSSFVKKQLETSHRQLIYQALEKHQVKAKLSYKLLPIQADRGQIFDQPIVAQKPKPAGLNNKYTFDNFVPGGGNNLAYAACQAVGASLGKKYNPLFIYGGSGVGKTHLIQAVGNLVYQKDPDLSVLYVTMDQFVKSFTLSIRDKSTEKFIEPYRQADVLIVDDIQFIAHKEKTKEEFFHIFNFLYQADKQIIISSDKPPQEIPTLEDRLRSRFQMGMLIDMQTPDLETRCAILALKAENMGLGVDDTCLEFLALNFTTNVRELEGALNQLNAYCEAKQIPVTLAAAQSIFERSATKRPGRLMPNQIINEVAKAYGLSSKEIKGPKREKEIVLPRQIAMYLLRSELQLSHPKIARELGRKDHTTAIHSINKVESGLKINPQLRESLSEIKKSLSI